MRLLLFFCLFAPLPLFAVPQSLPSKDPLLLAQASVFDPFIDYGEFQDNIVEEKSIIFFKNGRALSLSLLGGYEALTLNMRQIYGDAPLIGANISFFIDLHFALQVSGAFPRAHYNSLLTSTADFSHYGMDLKYYFNRQYSTKEVDFLNPYFIFGPFWINIKSRIPKVTSAIPISETPSPGNTPPPSTSQEELSALQSFNAAGIKVGLGIEFPLIKQSFVGAEITYLYTVLEHENQDLSGIAFPPPNKQNSNQHLMDRLLFPNRPEVNGYRFFGDLVNIIILFGVNF